MMASVLRWWRVRKYKKLLARVTADPRYRRHVEFGQPRRGHPEGTVRAHIAELEANLERLRPRLRNAESFWKIRFLIHTHDTFKAEARRGARIADPDSHASLARAFAAEFTTDADLLNMIQHHDEGYALWRQRARQVGYSKERLDELLNTIKDWNLFLVFHVVDGCTAGKDREMVRWLLGEVRRFRTTLVDESWIL